MNIHDHSFDLDCMLCIEQRPWLVYMGRIQSNCICAAETSEEAANGAALILAKRNQDTEYYVVCIQRKVKFCDVEWTEIVK